MPSGETGRKTRHKKLVRHFLQSGLKAIIEFGHEISSFFLRHFSRLSALGSSLDFAEPECRRLGSTADPIPLPKLKPRAVREHFIVPAIGSRDVACAEWPYIRRFEHFL
jgi:hypothetical protein